MSISYDPDQLAHLYVAATGLTSMELALYLPRALPFTAERFTLDVRYTSSPERSRALVHQAVGLLLGNGQWRALGPLPPSPDAGPAPFPDEVTTAVAGPDGASVTFHRVGGRVHVTYALDVLGAAAP